MTDAKLPEDVVTYCRIHAAKCDDEGLHTRSIVLNEAADEIERLRAGKPGNYTPPQQGVDKSVDGTPKAR